jgi:ParB family chromosome partitioning protein
MGHARALLAVDSANQITLANQIVAKRMSVREAEKLVVKTTAEQGTSKLRTGKEKSRDIARLEEELSDALATRVSIKLGAKNKGQLIIDFASLDALDDLIGKLRA